MLLRVASDLIVIIYFNMVNNIHTMIKKECGLKIIITEMSISLSITRKIKTIRYKSDRAKNLVHCSLFTEKNFQQVVVLYIHSTHGTILPNEILFYFSFHRTHRFISINPKICNLKICVPLACGFFKLIF